MKKVKSSLFSYDKIENFFTGENAMNNHPLEQLILDYLAEKDITKGSYDLYDTILKQYVSYLKEQNIIYAKTSDIINYRELKRNQGYSTKWMYLQMNTIKGFYTYLSSNQKRLGLPDIYAFNITETVKNERTHKTTGRSILTVDQAKQLILKTKENRKYIWQYRDHAIIYLMLTTALRGVEVRRSKRKDLQFINNQLVLYVQGKGRDSKDDYVKLTQGVQEAIHEYLNRRKDKNPYLFISYSHRTKRLDVSRMFFNKMLKRLLFESGMEDVKITPHALRHTAATLNLQRGGSLEETKRLMRHSNMSTTLIYAHHLDTKVDDSAEHIEAFILYEDD
jgi:site-specific recombinase XerD